MKNPTKTTKLFLDIQPVSRRGTTKVHGYKARWIARRTQTVFYTSSKRGTRADAEALAYKWFKRQQEEGFDYEDTTRPRAEKASKGELPFTHEFEGPGGVQYRIKFLGENDATFYASSTKCIIRIITGMSLNQSIVHGCQVKFLADNYAEAAKLAEGRVNC